MRLALTGDVMLGRGIDQIMRRPVDPTIHERWMTSAADYVELAERRSGPIPREVGPEYVWGDALPVLEALAPDATVVNLETAVTDDGTAWPGKGIQYRMSPHHVDTLVRAGVDVTTHANNHVLDWSLPGLEQTLDSLSEAGIRTCGAGRSAAEAWAPAEVALPTGGRVLVWSIGSTSSGIPVEWAAGNGPGVALISHLTTAVVKTISDRVEAEKQPDDVAVLSIHWGANWGYEVSAARRTFARRLIEEAQVDVVHGHSSHHPLGIEMHQGRLILYGCGDLITDYEGISGHEDFRGELSAIYLPRIDPRRGLVGLELLPTKVERFRLTPPSVAETDWLTRVLARESNALDTPLTFEGEVVLTAKW